jgi:peptidoglycan/LPS O-acetylase OafA/YrhL
MLMVASPAVETRAGKAVEIRPREGREAPAARDRTIDIVKGLLVVAMVVYHWLNIFVTAEGAVYKYLRFVTPSFIFVAGYLVTGGYLQKYRIGDPALHRRLFVRGAKLLALFTVLNVGVGVAAAVGGGGVRAGLEAFGVRAASMYWAGEGRRAAFEVLAPIGYLLMGAAGLLWGCKLHRQFLLGMWGVGVVAVYVWRGRGWETSTLELLTMGLLGMVIGGVSRESLDRLARRPWVWGAAYAALAMALSWYDAIYELQAAGLLIVMMLLYIAANRLDALDGMGAPLVLLGQYSLLAYVVHIAMLRGWARVVGPPGPEATGVVIAFGVALIGTWGVAELTRWTRRRSTLLDRLYRAVFA